MDGTSRMYGQPGPSVNTYQNQYSNHSYNPGRGRGNVHHGGRNYMPRHHQPNNMYPNRQPTMYNGYGSPSVNGVDRPATQDIAHYPHAQNTQVVSPIQRGRGNFTSISSPPMHASQPYGAHSPHLPPIHPYFAPGPPNSPPSMYHYSHQPPQAQMQPFPPPAFLHAPQPQPPFHYPQYQSLTSPVDALPEQAPMSPEVQKSNAPQPQPTQLVLNNTTSPKARSPIPVTHAILESLAPAPPSTTPASPSSQVQNLESSLPSPVIQDQNTSSYPSSIPEQPKSPERMMKILSYTNGDHEPTPSQEWVISSSRPDDPSDAFGIMISPRARPPRRIVNAALKYTSPAAHSVFLPKLSKEKSVEPTSSATEEVANENDVCEPPKTPMTAVDVHVSFPPRSDPISSSATETESAVSTAPDAFVPGSPLSTNTSVSLAAPKADSSSAQDVNDEFSTPTPSADATEAAATSEAPSHSPVSRSNVPAPPAAPIVRKSWASLFGGDGSSKSSLPTSTVIGFSVPAEAEKAASIGPLPTSLMGRRSELSQLLTNGLKPSTGIPTIRPRGLINTGNMCFANAVLQILVYCPPFYRFFTELGKYLPCDGLETVKWDGKATPLLQATVGFLKEFNPKVKTAEVDDDDYDGIDSFLPSNIYEAMKDKNRLDGMRGAQQEDAEEFFGFFLDTLEEELLSISTSLNPDTDSAPMSESNPSTEDGWMEVGKKNRLVVTRSTRSVDSPITRIFGGKFRSTLKVPGQRDSVIVEDWRTLQLDIQRDQVNSIEDALRFISHPQHVQVSSITKGNAVVDASQQVLVDSLPPILVLHLKRFLYDTTAKGVVKIGKQVTFGPELVIPSDVIVPTRRSQHPVKYKLFAVLYHHGQSAAGGHYTLDVLHPNRSADLSTKAGEGWIRIDDELVSDLRMQDVFKSNLDDRCAYLLFYRRVASSYARAGQNLA